MKIFGLQISRVKEADSSLAVEGSVPHQGLGIGVDRYVPLAKMFKGFNSQFFATIIWPSAEGLDAYEQVRYEHLIAKFVKEMKRYQFFNIVVVNDLHDLNCFNYTPETYAIKEKLSHLHCVPYANIPPDILKEIPEMMSAIFTEGRSLKDLPPSHPLLR